MALAKRVSDQLHQIEGLNVLSSSNDELRSSMTSFEVPGHMANEVFGPLMKAGFRCRPVYETGLQAIRISTHLYNSQDQCDKLIKAIKKVVKS